MIEHHPIAPSRREPVTFKRDERSSIALWSGVVIAVWCGCVDEDGLLAVWQACQASASQAGVSQGTHRMQLMNLFVSGTRTLGTEEQKNQLLKVINPRSDFRVVQEANIFESSEAVPNCVSRSTPILGSNVDCSRWFEDVEYAAEWLQNQLRRYNAVTSGEQTIATTRNTTVDYSTDDLLDVLSEIRGETTSIRLRLPALGLNA